MPAKLKYPGLQNKEWLYRKYHIDMLSTKQIAKEIGATFGAVSSWMQRHGIERRSIKESLSVRYQNGRCGKKAANWRGGKRVANGYVFLYTPGHPNATPDKPYIQEHRLIMEKHLGRFLETDEVVHHLNGVKTDNRIENLQVIKRGKHVSNHFKASHEVLTIREYIKELEAENEYLRAEIQRLQSRGIA